eukprot:Gb_39885 [translate_table: standard]
MSMHFFISKHFVQHRQGRAFSEIDFVCNTCFLNYRQTQIVILSVDIHGYDLSIFRQGKGSAEKRISCVYTNLHGVLGIYEFKQEIQELAFIRRGGHNVPWVFGCQFPQLLHWLWFSGIHTCFQNILVEGIALQKTFVANFLVTGNLLILLTGILLGSGLCRSLNIGACHFSQTCGCTFCDEPQIESYEVRCAERLNAGRRCLQMSVEGGGDSALYDKKSESEDDPMG